MVHQIVKFKIKYVEDDYRFKSYNKNIQGLKYINPILQKCLKLTPNKKICN